MVYQEKEEGRIKRKDVSFENMVKMLQRVWGRLDPLEIFTFPHAFAEKVADIKIKN